MTPRVRTGSIVPNTGSTDAGATVEVLIVSGIFADGIGLVLVLCSAGDCFKGKSSTNKVCVGLARVCSTWFEEVELFCCVPLLFV